MTCSGRTLDRLVLAGAQKIERVPGEPADLAKESSRQDAESAGGLLLALNHKGWGERWI